MKNLVISASHVEIYAESDHVLLVDMVMPDSEYEGILSQFRAEEIVRIVGARELLEHMDDDSIISYVEDWALLPIYAAWHNPEEVPEANREYLVLYFFKGYEFSDTRRDFECLCKEYWLEYVKTKGVKCWAYIDDLSPGMRKEERP